MKKIVIAILLVLLIGATYIYMKPVTFERNSVYLVMSEPQEQLGRSFHVAITYHGIKTISVEGIDDVKTTKQVEPAYHLNLIDEVTEGKFLQKKHTKTMLWNVTKQNASEFSKVRYKEFGQEKTVDVGMHHYELVTTPSVKLMSLDRIEHNDRVYRIIVDAEEKSIIKAEFTNPKIPASITKETKDGEDSFVIQVEQLPKDIDRFETSIRFTMMEDGSKTVLYGDGRISITKDSIGLDGTSASYVLSN